MIFFLTQKLPIRGVPVISFELRSIGVIYFVELLVKSQTGYVPQRHKSKNSEMFGLNEADKYTLSATAKN